VDLIRPYTLKGKDKTEIDIMCLTVIDPATSWLEIVELMVETNLPFPRVHRGVRAYQHIIHQRYQPYFDKSSAMISTLVDKTWFNM
jgi:hypothetical protein